MFGRLLLVFALTVCCELQELAAEEATYSPAKVIYDVSSPDALGRILDRASLLQHLYGDDPFEAAIIIVVHESAIPLFATSGQDQHKELMRRASSQAQGEIIQFRLCSASARMQGFGDNDFPGFVKLVPMADAEIVQLQNNGYAYLR